MNHAKSVNKLQQLPLVKIVKYVKNVIFVKNANNVSNVINISAKKFLASDTFHFTVKITCILKKTKKTIKMYQQKRSKKNHQDIERLLQSLEYF